MATALYRLGRFCARRARLVVVIWVALLALAGVGYAVGHGTLSSAVSIPGTATAKVTDPEKFDAYIRTRFADKLELRVELGDTAEICAVLADAGADDLYKHVESIPDWLVQEQLKSALAPGADIPGITVTTPPGVVSATPTPAAKALVQELLAKSPIPLLALESPSQEDRP